MFVDAIRERLSVVQIECNDALKVIGVRDNPETFFYIDPPYYNANMGHYGGYTLQDFESLLITLTTLKGKFLLSSYASDILTKYTKEKMWFTKNINLHISTSKNRKPKVEVLTANYER